MELVAYRHVCIFWLVHYVGYLGCVLLCWSIDLEHRWEGEWEFIWTTLAAIGAMLRRVPARFGLPMSKIP